MDQARVAAAGLAGRDAEHSAPPWFWSDQDTMKLQIAGWSQGHDDQLVLGDPDDERYSVLYFRDEALIAIDAVNRPPVHEP